MKQQLSCWPDFALLGCCLVSLHFLWGILHTSTVKTKKVTTDERRIMIVGCVGFDAGKGRMGRKEDVVGGRGEETKLRKEVMEGLGREVGLIVRSLLPPPSLYLAFHRCRHL